MDTLALYLSVVLTTIAPHLNRDRRESIAADIAAVTLSETRAFDDDVSGQQTALLLVSLAHYETGRSWAAWVDDGRCNDEQWRAAHLRWLVGGDCDGKRAWGMWQVHAPGDDPAIGRTYVVDRKTGIRAALAIARSSLQMGIGLCAYSGEKYPSCRLARMRLETARNWVSRFPYDPATQHADEPTGIE
jgi:hypothetical protein